MSAHVELLISRIVDGEAGAEEWGELQRLAAAEPRLWRELAEAQRDGAALRAAVSAAGALAERVPLPQHAVRGHRPLVQSLAAWRTWSGWSGWAVAAAITIVATARSLEQGRQPAVPPGQTSLAGVGGSSAADAFQAYLERGKEAGSVIAEVPTRVLLDTRPIELGEGAAAGYEVVYLRQVMERAIVPNLYQIDGQTESGRPTLVRYSKPVQSSM